MTLKGLRKLTIFLQILPLGQNLHFKETLILRSDLFYVTGLDYNSKTRIKRLFYFVLLAMLGVPPDYTLKKQENKTQSNQQRLRKTQSIFSNKYISI